MAQSSEQFVPMRVLVIGLCFRRGQFQLHFGNNQSVWRDGDWNGFVRIALAGLLAPLIELARGVGHHAPKFCVKMGDELRAVS